MYVYERARIKNDRLWYVWMTEATAAAVVVAVVSAVAE